MAAPASTWLERFINADLGDHVAFWVAIFGGSGAAWAWGRAYLKRRREARMRRHIERAALLAALEALGVTLGILADPLADLLPPNSRDHVAVARHQVTEAARRYRAALGLPPAEQPAQPEDVQG